MAGEKRWRRVRGGGGGLVLALVTLATCAATTAQAEPYMAIREGRKCGTCHVNETGGGMRTLLAQTHLEEITHYHDIFPQLGEAGEVWNGQVANFFAVGGDLRLDDTIVFQDEPNADGLVPHKVFRGNVDENILDVREFATYFDFKLVEDYLDVYVDVNWLPGSPVAREAFGLLRGILPGRGYVIAGRFYLDYGLKMETDNLFSINLSSQDLFVRGRTGTGFTGFDQGLEIGFEPGPFHLTTSVTNAATGDSTVRVTSNAYGMFRDLPVIDNAMLGGSFMYSAPEGQDQYIWGFYGGSNLGPIEYQAEVDFIHQAFDDMPNSIGTFLVYGEVNYLLLDWINTKAFGEYADNDGQLDRTGTAQNRYGFGIEPFLGRFLQTRLYYSIANGPKDLAQTNQNRLVMEIHLFF